MAKFDTHGGHFAPQGYLKVNEGGSHEENPNGGVQIGVDPQGVPNMLEEGEPVYNDYVYSDNIVADEEMLVKHNIPKKFAGKLYSEIADKFVDEAEERPLDPISTNGLEAMLGRLAEAQEEQKQVQQQRELEDELSRLSPEELYELEAMLAEQEQTQQGGAPGEAVPQEAMMPQEQYPAEQVPGMEQVPAEQPMIPMAMGGTMLRKFDEGTPGKVVSAENIQIPENINNYTPQAQLPSLLELALGSDSKVVEGVNKAQESYKDWVDNTTVGGIVDAFIPRSAMEASGTPLTRGVQRTAGPIARGAKRLLKKTGTAIKKLPGKLAEVEGRKAMLQEAGAAVRETSTAAAAARDEAQALAQRLDDVNRALKADPTNPVLLEQAAQLEADVVRADRTYYRAARKAAGAKANAANKAVGAVTGGPMYNRAALEKEISGLQKAYDTAKAAAEASPKDKALQEAFEAAGKALEKAKTGWNKWWNHGEWQYKAPVAGAFAGYDVFSNRKEKKDNWVEDQFSTGGLLRTPVSNEFALGSEMYTYDDPVSPGYFAGYPEWSVLPWSGRDIFYEDGISSPQTQGPLVLAPGQTMLVENPEQEVFIEDTTPPTPPSPPARRILPSDAKSPWFTGTLEDFVTILDSYGNSTREGGISGRYAIDRRFPTGDFKNIRELEASEKYKAWTQYCLDHPEDPRVISYFKKLDERTPAGVPKLMNGDKLSPSWKTLFEDRRTDGNGGVYHLTYDVAGLQPQAPEVQQQVTPQPPLPESVLLSVINKNIDNGTFKPVIDKNGKIIPLEEEKKKEPEKKNPEKVEARTPLLSTFPQYAGAIGNAGLALWNAAQPADDYSVETPYPYLPYGRINLVDPTYNPMDQNASVNNTLANSSATTAALLQSGAGYGAIPAVLASGYNTGRAMGDNLATIWDANNQRHNAVLAGVNNNRAQTAQFNYANERDRANALNQYGYIRSRNNLLEQQLDYGAEGQKYGAIGKMLGNSFEALSGIGRNNVILNQINTNRKNEGFGIAPNGAVGYYPGMYYSALGGFLKKYKG